MTHTALRLIGIALGALAEAACAQIAQPALSVDNFVDIGDNVSEMLDTSGLSFSTTMMTLRGSARDADAIVRASIVSTGAAAPLALSARPVSAVKICPGGGQVKVDLVDADASGELSPRDSVALTFESCVLDGQLVSGRSRFIVRAHRYEGLNELTELEFHFDALGSTRMRWSGTAHAILRSDLKRGTESYGVTYRDLRVTRGARAMRWNFSLDAVRPPIGAEVISVHGAMTIDGLTLALRQDDPYVVAVDGHPRAGQATATDARGARLQIEAGRWRYSYRYFGVGNPGEVPDAASQSPPYRGRTTGE